jgi:hypothetical protein
MPKNLKRQPTKQRRSPNEIRKPILTQANPLRHQTEMPLARQQPKQLPMMQSETLKI